MDYTTAAPPALLTFTATKSGNGSDCGAGLGSTWSLAWTVNGAVVNGTHSLRLSFGYDGSSWTVATTTASPTSASPIVVTTDRLVSSGKFDATVPFYFKAELIVTAGGALLDTKTTAPQEFASVCPI
jgi:hypothetical protein